MDYHRGLTKSNSERNGDFPSIVELNVGGHVYTTTLNTLLSDSESHLANIFSGKTRINRDNRGRYFIDRDGALFRYILDYLRNRCLLLPETFHEKARLLKEAEFFQIKGLIKSLNSSTSVSQIILSNRTTSKARDGGYISISVRGSYAFGRDGLADVKFRKLQRILVCGNVALTREVFHDTLNETRDPDRASQRYTNRFYLKHNQLERAFDQLHEAGFRLITSSAGGAGYDQESDETKWNHFTNYVFYRE